MNAEQEKDQLRSAAVGIAALRVWLGAWFLLMAALKLPIWGRAFDFAGRLRVWMDLALDHGCHPQYKPVLEALVKYSTGVTWAVTLMEGAIGVLLVLGLFTRFASFGAIFLYTNYWLAAARLGYATAGISITLGVTAACLALANAGMFYGLDAARERRKTSTLAPPIGSRT